MPEVRLCDKDAEIERIKQYCSARGCEHKYWSIYCKACEVADMIDEFENAQEVDSEPVRHGRWIIKRDEFYTAYKMYYAECSECKHAESQGMAERLKYCPNCGARMDGGADNG